MLHSSRKNSTVKDLRERCLPLIYNDKPSSYNELSLKDGSVFVYRRNIQNLAIGMFKVKNDLSLEIVTDTFLLQTQNQYNLRIQNDFRAPLIRSVSHGSDSISFIGPNIWNSLPSDLKRLEFLNIFKKQIRT